MVSNPTNTITLSKDYQLSTAITGNGAISDISSGFSCSSSCKQNYKSETQITLQATATSKSKFDGWNGACTGTQNCIVSMSKNQSVNAVFSDSIPNTVQLLVNSNAGGTIRSKLPGIDCGTDCTEIYTTGNSVTLTAIADPKYTFIRWSGACSGIQDCNISMNKNETVTAYFSSGNMTNLCDGLITDKLDHPMTALTKPANGSIVIDPEFGTTIRRISAASSGSVIKPMYSTIQAWNADESYLILYHTKDNKGHHLYDGKTYKYIKKLNFTPADIEQVFWHTLDPDIFMYVNKSSTPTLIAYRISTDTKESIHIFKNCSRVSSGDDPMFISWDSDVIGLLCQQSTAGRTYLSYRISTNTESSRIITNGTAAPQSAPSGNLFFYAGNGKSDILNFNGVVTRTLDLGSPYDHASLGMLSDGTDMFYGVDFGGAANCKAGALVAHNMVNG